MSAAEIPQNIRSAAITRWLKGVSDERLRKLAEWVWREGMRRGWSKWWMQ